MGLSREGARSTTLGREQFTPMPFFPKDKQSLGIIWHCQKLAFGEVGVVNIALTRRSSHLSHCGSTRWGKLVWLQHTPWRLALWGSIAHFLTLGYEVLAHMDSQKDSQKCSKHFNCLL